MPAAKFNLIDLTVNGVHGNKAAKGKVLVCKFVLVDAPEERNLILGQVEKYRYHAALVREFCQLRNLPSGWARRPDLYEIYDQSCGVRGGGWLDIDRAASTLRFYHYSTAYGGFDPEFVSEFVRECLIFPGYSMQF